MLPPLVLTAGLILIKGIFAPDAIGFAGTSKATVRLATNPPPEIGVSVSVMPNCSIPFASSTLPTKGRGKDPALFPGDPPAVPAAPVVYHASSCHCAVTFTV